MTTSRGAPAAVPVEPGRPAPEGPSLQRAIRLPGLVLYGVGTTVGAGVYGLLGVVAGRAGASAPLAFLLASILAAFTALSFAELSARIPKAGGEAIYVHRGFGHVGLARIVGVLTALAGTVSAATVSTAFVGYLGELVSVPYVLAILGVVLGVGAIAVWGTAKAVAVAGLMTLVEVGGLLLVVAFAGEHWLALPERAPELWPGFDPSAWDGVVGAALVAFYAFLGFEDMVNVAEEVEDVQRTLPLGILLTLGITALLYVLVATSAVLVVDPAELGRSQAPLALVFERAGGNPVLLTVIALFAMLNGALIQLMKSSRVVYGMGSMGWIPSAWSRIHPRTRTPIRATLLVTAVAGGLALAFPLDALAAITSRITLVTFALANLALVVLKRREPAPRGVRTVPVLVPWLGFGLSLGFALFVWQA
jgi:APA family basic amino acid/polyamine antiporter